MNLAPLLQAHRTHAKAGLPENLGDGYLVTKNFIYRRIREEALNAGFQFSSRPDPSFLRDQFLYLPLRTTQLFKKGFYRNRPADTDSLPGALLFTCKFFN